MKFSFSPTYVVRICSNLFSFHLNCFPKSISRVTLCPITSIWNCWVEEISPIHIYSIYFFFFLSLLFFLLLSYISRSIYVFLYSRKSVDISNLDICYFSKRYIEFFRTVMLIQYMTCTEYCIYCLK